MIRPVAKAGPLRRVFLEASVLISHIVKQTNTEIFGLLDFVGIRTTDGRREIRSNEGEEGESKKEKIDTHATWRYMGSSLS